MSLSSRARVEKMAVMTTYLHLQNAALLQTAGGCHSTIPSHATLTKATGDYGCTSKPHMASGRNQNCSGLRQAAWTRPVTTYIKTRIVEQAHDG